MPFLPILEALKWWSSIGVPLFWTVPGCMSFFVVVVAMSPCVPELLSLPYLYGFSHAPIDDS